jgi:endogenous inhibitor of DNA gyrase (YacG/DUF329 family)
MDRAADAPTCVFCRRRPIAPEWRPFCSERCKLRDLARWADGDYRIAAEPVGSPDETTADPNRDRD